jgi:hypothetical protein
MKDKEKYIKIAHKHLSNNPFPHRDYEWVLKDECIKLDNEIYFDYSLKHKKDVPEDKWENFAGAPGFCVHLKTLEIRDITWDEYQEMIQR